MRRLESFVVCGAGLSELAGQHLSVPTDNGASAAVKVTPLGAGMVCDEIVVMSILAHPSSTRVDQRRPPKSMPKPESESVTCRTQPPGDGGRNRGPVSIEWRTHPNKILN